MGRVVKPHGLRGEVVVQLLTDRPERFRPGTALAGDDRDLVIEAARPHQARLLVKFVDVGDRTAAERLRGSELSTVRAADEDAGDTYLADELVGMRVVADDGRDLGRVTDLIDLPPAAEYDLLEVTRDDGSTWLLPAVDDYVAVEDDEAGGERLVLTDPPSGLVDGDAEVVPPR